MDKPSSSRPPQRSALGRRLRLIPTTLRPEGIAIPPPPPMPQNTGVPQPPETFGRNLYANIIRETRARWNQARLASGEAPEPTQSSTSSSSLRFSDCRDFDEITDEFIQEIREEERERVSGETQEAEEPVMLIGGEERLPQGRIFRGNSEAPRAEKEGDEGLDEWKAHMEDTMNQLLIENALLNGRVRFQEEQTDQLFRIMERMFSGEAKGTQVSRQPLQANSSSSQNQPSRPNAEVHLVEYSRKRRPSTSQSTSPAKRTRNSGSEGGQDRN